MMDTDVGTQKLHRIIEALERLEKLGESIWTECQKSRVALEAIATQQMKLSLEQRGEQPKRQANHSSGKRTKSLI